jgi:Ca2+-binding RTX toxin-like protein
VFVVTAGTGADTIADFVDGQDKIGLDNALGFSDLAIAQDGNNATISSGGVLLATVIGGVATNFTDADFVNGGSSSGGGTGNNILGTALPDTIGTTTSPSTVQGVPGNIATNAADTIDGAGGNDTISGLDGNDSILGSAGDDSILGGNGNDIINGGDDNDIIDGGAGNDSISGAAGDNTIVGGAGTDTLTGGSGVSFFAFAAPTEGTDTITDFVGGTDKIRILASAFGGTTSSSVATVANSGGFTLVSATAPVALGANPNFLFDETSKFLKFDADGAGSGAAVDLAFLTGVSTLAIGDFSLI